MDRNWNLRRPIRRYEYSEVGHLRPNCPFRKSQVSETLNNIELGMNEERCFESCIFNAEVNGELLPVSFDTGASIMLSQLFVDPENYTGKITWVKQPLDKEQKCLPLSNTRLEGNFGIIHTKASVIRKSQDWNLYILGNHSFKLLKKSQNSGKTVQQTKGLACVQAELNFKLLKKDWKQRAIVHTDWNSGKK